MNVQNLSQGALIWDLCVSQLASTPKAKRQKCKILDISINVEKKQRVNECSYAAVNQSVGELPSKIVSPFLCTAPLRYVPKILLTQDTFDCLPTDKTKNAHGDKTVILNYIGGDPISHSLSNEPFVNVL